MDSPRSASTNRRLEDLCSRALGDLARDPQRRLELRHHLEDKLFAYLRGTEPLTEDDALLLVEKHLGKPEPLRAAFADAQVIPHEFWRRFAAIVILWSALDILTLPAGLMIGYWSDHIPVGPVNTVQNWLLFAAAIYALPALRILGVLVILWRAQAHLRRGRRPWFVRSNGWVLGSVAASLVLISSSAPLQHVVTPLHSGNHELLANQTVWQAMIFAPALICVWWFSPIGPVSAVLGPLLSLGMMPLSLALLKLRHSGIENWTPAFYFVLVNYVAATILGLFVYWVFHRLKKVPYLPAR